ncbi:MAG: RNA-binding S4 domain-containing protein [Colwellia sp.]|nr:RNA-binding S4 domain-containing protein [Colwellia sp.]
MPASYLEIQLDQQPIELCKLLKIANLVAGGGEAKVVISEGYVLLNGEVEYQKRKKIYHNDIVEFNGETLQVIVNEDLANTTTSTPENDTTGQAAYQTQGSDADSTTRNSAERKAKQRKNKSNKAEKTAKKTALNDEGAVNKSKSKSKRKSISF